MPSRFAAGARKIVEGLTKKFSRRTSPVIAVYDTEDDELELNRFDDNVTLELLGKLYRDSSIARRLIDLPVHAAFRNGFLSDDVDPRTVNDLVRLYVGVLLYGESTVIFSDDDTFQVAYPAATAGANGYSVRFDAGRELGITLTVRGSEPVEIEPEKYRRIFSPATDPFDAYHGVSVLRNQYWTVLALTVAIHQLCGQVRVLSGGFFYWNLSESDVDASDAATVTEAVKNALDNKILLVRGAPDAPEPKIVSPTSQSYSMMDFIQFLLRTIAAEYGIPEILVLGTPGGKLSTSDSSIRAWYDAVRKLQSRILPDVREVLGRDVEFADPAGVEEDTATKLADALLKLKQVVERDSLEELASRLLPNIKWKVKEDVQPLPGVGGGVGPLGGGDRVVTLGPPGGPGGPAREKSDGASY